jgi:hypothetical protein
MVLQHAHVVFILKCVIIVDEGFSRLSIILKGPPLLLFDMLFATRGGLRI